MTSRRGTRAWQETCAAILTAAKARNDPCSLCGEPIDWTARPRSSLAPSVDHRLPIAKGGSDHLSNLAPSHYGCNSAKRDRAQPNTSRIW